MDVCFEGHNDRLKHGHEPGKELCGGPQGIGAVCACVRACASIFVCLFVWWFGCLKCLLVYVCKYLHIQTHMQALTCIYLHAHACTHVHRNVGRNTSVSMT